MTSNNTRILDFKDYEDFGYSARDAYRSVGRRYHWDMSLAESFGPQRLLYAKDATLEGFSVWFLAHSNFNEEDNGIWRNSFDGDYIREEWLNQNMLHHNKMILDHTVRVVFAKKKSGKYYFMGVYVLDNFEKNDDGNRVKIYRRISTVYPVGENEELARYIKAWEDEE